MRFNLSSAVKHQGIKDENAASVDSADLVGQAAGDSGRTVQRYIRLTCLIPELLKLLDEGKIYLNKVRERAGIPKVEDSWKGVASLDQAKLREIVHRERQIELYLENHNFWDLRRWGIAESLGEQPMGLSVKEKELERFAQPMTVDVQRRFISAHYLLPIPIEEVNMNDKMVQNPGYND